MSYRLSIAGAPHIRRSNPNWPTLVAEAVDHAKRGYTAVLTEGDNRSRGLEVGRRNGELYVTTFDHGNVNPDLLPPWINQAHASITSHLARSTTT